MARDFRLPDLGEGIAEGQIVRLLCQEGDQVSEDQDLIEVETDKAAVPIPSPFAGTISKIHVKEGETVSVGDVLVSFDGEAGESDSKESAESKEEPKRKQDQAEQEEATSDAGGRKGETAQAAGGDSKQHDSGGGTAVAERPSAPPKAKRTRAVAAPAIRKLARELDVDIDSISGSGPGGRVTREDVEQAKEQGEARPESRPATQARGKPASGDRRPAAPAPRPMAPPEIEGVPGEDDYGPIKRANLTQIRKTIANQMVRSVSNIPHVTQTDEADVTLLEQMRRELRGKDDSGPRVTMTALVLRVLAICLREHPQFNASFDAENEEIVYKEYMNIGVAVDSSRGLVVPVIRGIDQLSVLAISEKLYEMAEKVRNVQFAIEDLRGGTFTITNYGAIGSILGTPIINYPEVAILGMGRTQDRLVLVDDEIESHRILPLSLSFDHRAVDGAQAGRFLNDVKAHLESPGLLLIK